MSFLVVDKRLRSLHEQRRFGALRASACACRRAPWARAADRPRAARHVRAPGPRAGAAGVGGTIGRSCRRHALHTD